MNEKNMNWNQNKEKKFFMIGAFFFCVSVFLFLLCCSQGLRADIWYDEVFSLKFAELPYREIALATAKDVHPPFYYWYLRLVQGILKMLFPSVHPFVLGKMASMIPFLFMFLYGITLIRKRFGLPVAGVFLFLLLSMPQLSNYVVEVRMYSLALFFITAFFLHSVEAMTENRIKDYVFLFLYGILTAYTQYYACIAIATIYICLLVAQKRRKNLQGVKRCLFCIVLSVLCYLPWLPKFYGQLQAVRENYWIQPLSFRSVFGCLKYLFLPVSQDGSLNYVWAVLMIIICAGLFFFLFIRKNDFMEKWMGLVAILVPLMAFTTGWIASILGRPIFVYRYFIPGLGVSWLVMAILLVKQWKNRYGILLLLPFLLASYFNMKGFYMEEHKKNLAMEETEELLESLPDDAVVLTNFNHVQAVIATYLSNPVFLYGAEPEPLMKELLPGCDSILPIEESTALVDLVRNKNVYFLGSFNVREELLKQWKTRGISYEEEGSFLLERYWFNVYHLEIEKNR